MKPFPYAHATHPQWRMAAALVLAQLRAQLALPHAARCPNLALLYITDHYAAEAQGILDHLSAELPEVTDWAGTVGVGIAANNVEYFDEPALAVMLCDLSPFQYRVFSGVSPLAASGADGSGFVANTALLHADGQTPELGELIVELAERTASGFVLGGLASSRHGTVQFASASSGTLRGQGAAKGVFFGGLSGVAFGPSVALLSRVTQGAQPLGALYQVTEADGNLVLGLGGVPALDVLLAEQGLSLDNPQEVAERLRSTLVGLTFPHQQVADEAAHQHRRLRRQFGPEVAVRHVLGLDTARRGVAVAERVPVGTQLAFCARNAQAACADLMRVCAEIREELEPEGAVTAASLGPYMGLAPREERDVSAELERDAATPIKRRIAGALYVSCAGRGGPHFGAPSAEMQIVRHALGDVPLVGFFAGGEIAHQQLYGYTGVLTVFTMPV